MEMAEPLGFNTLSCVEHHFDDYAVCPDNTQLLSYMAARTSTITLATGAVILPWNDPLRVAEKIVLLDHLAKGRLRFGMGRGLARMEYAGFRQDMNESRARFDEAARMITDALETGQMEHEGEYYSQPAVDIRPTPTRSFKDRTYSVAMTPDSADAAASLGTGMLCFITQPVEDHLPSVESYRSQYQEAHGTKPRAVVFSEFMYCSHDEAEAEKAAREYIGNYFLSVVKHYEFAGTHFDDTKGYKAYGAGAAAIREAGMEAATEGYVNAQIWGTPSQIIEKVQKQKELVGDLEIEVVVSYGGMPFEQVRKSYELFAKEVLPELNQL
jgi:alkanesulfonate monooxygenase SsuD/methylene tetrahydromethanopterin reductase-like flavin-dependent oxidoreductase (luciferase family)